MHILLFPAALIAALMTSSTIWICADRSVWPFDQAWYGEMSLDLWHMRQDGFAVWIYGNLHAFQQKPPLLAWIGQLVVPLSTFTNNVESTLLGINIAAASATLVLVYMTGQRVAASAASGIAAILLCGGASLFIGLTHQFMVEILQCSSVAAMIAIAWRAEHRSFGRTLSLIILVSAVGMLIKASSPLFMIPLVTYVVVALIVAGRDRPAFSRRDIPLAFLAISCAILASAWYLINWDQMLAHIVSSAGEEAILYGSPARLFEKLTFWINAIAMALSPSPLVGIGALLAAILAMAYGLIESLRSSIRTSLAAAVANGTLFAITLGGAIVTVWFVYSLQPNQETRLLAPILPIIAVLTGWSLQKLGRGFIVVAIVGLLANGLVAHLYAHGWNRLNIAPSSWLTALNYSDISQLRLTQSVQLSCPRQDQNQYVIVGVEYPTFNANSAAFYSSKAQLRTGYRCYYTSLGYAESDINRAYQRIFAMNAAYVITIRPDQQLTQPGDPFNRVSRLFAERISDDPHFALVPQGPTDVLIFRKVRN